MAAADPSIPDLVAFDLDDTLWYPEMYMVSKRNRREIVCLCLCR